MKLFFVLFFFFISFLTLCQDTIFFDKNFNKINSKIQAEYYSIINYDKEDRNIVSEKVYFNSSQIKSEKKYSNYKERIQDGNYKEFYKNGLLKRNINYLNGRKQGQLLTYWSNGNLKRNDNYESDKLINGKCYGIDGKDTLYYNYEIPAIFKGGEQELYKWVSKNTVYPIEERDKMITGKVIISFVVEKDGSISTARVVKSVTNNLDNEALRVILNMPNWNPGFQDGEPVRVGYSLPITFNFK